MIIGKPKQKQHSSRLFHKYIIERFQTFTSSTFYLSKTKTLRKFTGESHMKYYLPVLINFLLFVREPPVQVRGSLPAW
jgi:hypothetical protein